MNIEIKISTYTQILTNKGVIHMGAGSALHAQILADQSYLNQSWQIMPTSKFFIMSTEFDKNISDLS